MEAATSMEEPLDDLDDPMGSMGLACMPSPDDVLDLSAKLQWAARWPARTALSVFAGAAWLRCLVTLACACEIDIIGNSLSYSAVSVVDHALVHPHLAMAALLSPLDALHGFVQPMPHYTPRPTVALLLSLVRLWMVLAVAPLLSGSPAYALAIYCWGCYEACRHWAIAAEACRGQSPAPMTRRQHRQRAAAAACDVLVLLDAARRGSGQPLFWAAAGVRGLVSVLLVLLTRGSSSGSREADSEALKTKVDKAT